MIFNQILNGMIEIHKHKKGHIRKQLRLCNIYITKDNVVKIGQYLRYHKRRSFLSGFVFLWTQFGPNKKLNDVFSLGAILLNLI